MVVGPGGVRVVGPDGSSGAACCCFMGGVCSCSLWGELWGELAGLAVVSSDEGGVVSTFSCSGSRRGSLFSRGGVAKLFLACSPAMMCCCSRTFNVIFTFFILLARLSMSSEGGFWICALAELGKTLEGEVVRVSPALGCLF